MTSVPSLAWQKATQTYLSGVTVMHRTTEAVKEGQPVDLSAIDSLVHTLVDLALEGQAPLQHLSTVSSAEDADILHPLNVGVLCVTFGATLRLTRAQLCDLGKAALLHGVCGPSDEHRTEAAVLKTLRAWLHKGPVDRSTLTHAVAIYERVQDLGMPVKDNVGNIERILPKTAVGVFGRILAICDAYATLVSQQPSPDTAVASKDALTFMWLRLRHQFDPQLLRTFLLFWGTAPPASS